MVHKSKKTLLERLYARLRRNKSRDFINNTAILNDAPKNHKSRKNKIVQK